MRENKEVQVNMILDAAAVATITSAVIDLQHAWGYCMFAKWTKLGGVLAGSVVLEKSINLNDWYTVSTDNIVDASGSAIQEKTDVTYRFARVKATLTGGSATVLIETNTKGA